MCDLDSPPKRPFRVRAAAIIIQDQSVLLIHRHNMGREYYVLPGGGVEAGESDEEACVREVREELSLEVLRLEEAFTLMNNGHREHYFWTVVQPGEPVLGGPEAVLHSAEDSYVPEWVALRQLREINLLPEAAREWILPRWGFYGG